MSKVHEFSDVAAEPAVRGFLHEPSQASGDGLANGDGLVLTHGAGANCQSKLLIALADEFATAGYVVLRCDLPFRQSRERQMFLNQCQMLTRPHRVQGKDLVPSRVRIDDYQSNSDIDPTALECEPWFFLRTLPSTKVLQWRRHA